MYALRAVIILDQVTEGCVLALFYLFIY